MLLTQNSGYTAILTYKNLRLAIKFRLLTFTYHRHRQILHHLQIFTPRILSGRRWGESGLAAGIGFSVEEKILNLSGS
jgi:hypothetical protein